MHRPRYLLATATVLLFGAGSAPAAFADSETRAVRASEARDAGAAVTEQRQRRVEEAWLAEQHRAAARGRRRLD
jgi:hypothetical protein